ncbi:MAG: MerR family transcriptional regulator [Candidatus Omnitrophica bacterium]|nr:MerR family transcriptional regulator [Candidatus Omnitrophota bacterium]
MIHSLTREHMGDIISNVYLIKDLARLSGYSIHTLKFYLKIGLIKESSRSPETHYRYFDDSTLLLLQKIRQLRKQSKSLKDIKNELL